MVSRFRYKHFPIGSIQGSQGCLVHFRPPDISETTAMVTTCLENLEMSGTAVREMLGILLKIREMSGKKSCQGKVT